MKAKTSHCSYDVDEHPDHRVEIAWPCIALTPRCGWHSAHHPAAEWQRKKSPCGDLNIHVGTSSERKAIGGWENLSF